jgi:DmsE family decaheme c-type cytochrome
MRKAIIVALSLGACLAAGLVGVSTNLAGEAPAEPTYVGPEVCKACHADMVESYELGTHGVKDDPRTPAAKEGCESCHGPGSEHVRTGGGKGVAGIVALDPAARTSAEQKNALCLSCHTRGKMALWHGSAHDRRGIACSDCHSVHKGHPRNLTADTATELCVRCHKDVKADLQRPSHHPLREGKMECSDCHNPHGTATDGLISANSINENCYRCHAEKRGPFLWQHPPVTEDCTNCHRPHGSSHDKLLTAKVPYLCQTCHSNPRHPGLLYAIPSNAAGQSVYVALNNRAFYRSCQNCHVQVHGSNHPSGKSYMR